VVVDRRAASTCFTNVSKGAGRMSEIDCKGQVKKVLLGPEMAVKIFLLKPKEIPSEDSPDYEKRVCPRSHFLGSLFPSLVRSSFVCWG